MVNYYLFVFYYLRRLLFSSFLQIEVNSLGGNSSKCNDRAAEHSLPIISHFCVAFFLSQNDCLYSSFHVEMTLMCKTMNARENLISDQYERLSTKTRFKTELIATRKWPIGMCISVSERFHAKMLLSHALSSNADESATFLPSLV